MSQLSPAQMSLIVNFYYLMSIQNFCTVAATTLIFYDYLITLSEEIRVVWKSRVTGATALFLLNRYVMLLYRISVAARINRLEISILTCSIVLDLSETLLVIWQLTVAVFMALRMYAIWNRSRNILIGTLILGLFTPVISIHAFVTAMKKMYIEKTPICGIWSDLNTPPDAFHVILYRATSILVDIIILILTWMKTAGLRKMSLQLKVKTPIVILLLRDGTLYFAFLMILNAVNLITFATFTDPLHSLTSSFTDVTTSILITRLMLNLRNVYLPSGDSSISSSAVESDVSDVRFARAIGNLGAPLHGTSLSEQSTIPGEECEHDRNDDYDRSYISDDPLSVGLMPTLSSI